MALKFKNRSAETNLRKVMIYGKDGSGKSTFAEQYCRENNLKPVCIDIDDTNYTNVPILELNFRNDIKTYTGIKEAIEEISRCDDFDTIILDGVTSLLEMLVSKAKGLKKYSDRAERFQDLLRALMASGKHLIFVGQADMEVIYNEEFQSSKMVIKVNSIVNEKYLTYKKKEGYSHKVVKYRTFQEKGKDDTSVGGETPKQVDDDPLRAICQDIKRQVELDGKLVTKSTMKSKLVKLIKAGEIEKDMRPSLIKYINQHCPEELE